jgi:hypothetical protein
MRNDTATDYTDVSSTCIYDAYSYISISLLLLVTKLPRSASANATV